MCRSTYGYISCCIVKGNKRMQKYKLFERVKSFLFCTVPSYCKDNTSQLPFWYVLLLNIHSEFDSDTKKILDIWLKIKIYLILSKNKTKITEQNASSVLNSFNFNASLSKLYSLFIKMAFPRSKWQS